MVRHLPNKHLHQTELGKMLTSERTVAFMNHSVTIKLTSAESETKVSILFNCVHFQGVDKKSWLVLCQIALRPYWCTQNDGTAAILMYQKIRWGMSSFSRKTSVVLRNLHSCWRQRFLQNCVKICPPKGSHSTNSVSCSSSKRWNLQRVSLHVSPYFSNKPYGHEIHLNQGNCLHAT